MKLEGEKIKYSVSNRNEEEIKEINEKMEFFKSQKEGVEKEKEKLKKLNAELEAEIEEMLSENESAHEMVYKIEALEEKNQKIRQELEAANL